MGLGGCVGDEVAAALRIWRRRPPLVTDDRPEALDVADLALHLVLDDATLDRKLAALTAMPSQTAAALATLSPDEYTELNHIEFFVTA